MFPRSTDYRLADTPADYRALHAFFRAEAEHEKARTDQLPAYQKFQVSFPTVYARREGRVIGVMASQFHPEYGLVVSPFHVAYDIKNHVYTALRLIDCYEAILAYGGVSEYLILLPAWKPSIRLFSELKESKKVAHLPHLRLDLYHVSI